MFFKIFLIGIDPLDFLGESLLVLLLELGFLELNLLYDALEGLINLLDVLDLLELHLLHHGQPVLEELLSLMVNRIKVFNNSFCILFHYESYGQIKEGPYLILLS